MFEDLRPRHELHNSETHRDVSFLFRTNAIVEIGYQLIDTRPFRPALPKSVTSAMSMRYCNNKRNVYEVL